MSFKYEETLCPDCNGQMISRKSQYGVFWGCKAYPQCKGTRDVNGDSKADREAYKREQNKTTDSIDLVNYDEDNETKDEVKDKANKFSFRHSR